jgi:outer membrane protein assembly factor BamE (lipoprotein component of BamABCDE complex)
MTRVLTKSTVLLVLLALSASGCSVAMAAHQPSRKDTDLLSPGVPRNLILAELGAPVTSDTKDGKRVEVFSFVQGYRKGVRIGRTVGHATADVLTLGLWEVAGTPTEVVLDGTKVAYEVTFDANDKVERVIPLKQ